MSSRQRKVDTLRAFYERNDEEVLEEKPLRPEPAQIDIFYKPRLRPAQHQVQCAFDDIDVLTDESESSHALHLMSLIQATMFTEAHPTIQCEIASCPKEAACKCSLCGCYLCTSCEDRHQKILHRQSYRERVNWLELARLQASSYKRLTLYSKNQLFGIWLAPFDSRTVEDVAQFVNERLIRTVVHMVFHGVNRIKENEWDSFLYRFKTEDDSLKLTFTTKASY